MASQGPWKLVPFKPALTLIQYVTRGVGESNRLVQSCSGSGKGKRHLSASSMRDEDLSHCIYELNFVSLVDFSFNQIKLRKGWCGRSELIKQKWRPCLPTGFFPVSHNDICTICLQIINTLIMKFIIINPNLTAQSSQVIFDYFSGHCLLPTHQLL